MPTAIGTGGVHLHVIWYLVLQSFYRFYFLCQVKKEMLLDPKELQQFHNHSSQMAALDFMVSIASNTFIPTYDGNMAKLVEGHRR